MDRRMILPSTFSTSPSTRSGCWRCHLPRCRRSPSPPSRMTTRQKPRRNPVPVARRNAPSASYTRRASVAQRRHPSSVTAETSTAALRSPPTPPARLGKKGRSPTRWRRKWPSWTAPPTSSASRPMTRLSASCCRLRLRSRALSGSRGHSPLKLFRTRKPRLRRRLRTDRRRMNGWRRLKSTRSDGAAANGGRSTFGSAACPRRTCKVGSKRSAATLSWWITSSRRERWRMPCARYAAAATRRSPTKFFFASGARLPCTRTATGSPKSRRTTGCAGRATWRRRTRRRRACRPAARPAGSGRLATDPCTTRGRRACCAR
mmetsp:Transcript_405/g.1897  ORF Transcript_405/g.1897 Transcript_405/m.1897 type:complete len:318 (+) Transcript_405:2029-2982(+)